MKQYSQQNRAKMFRLTDKSAVNGDQLGCHRWKLARTPITGMHLDARKNRVGIKGSFEKKSASISKAPHNHVQMCI